MKYALSFLVSLLCACQNHTEQPTSPFVVQQGDAIYWAITPKMDSVTLHALSQALLNQGIFFKPVINRDENKRITQLWGNMIVFDRERTELTDTLLSNQLILPEDRKNWIVSQSINVGNTKAALLIPSLGFWYDPKSGLHSDIVGENFPKSLVNLVEKEFSSALATQLAEQNAQRIKNFKAAFTKGKPAFDFSLTDSVGNKVSLRDYRGKVVYLDFWAHWCGPCIQEMDEMKSQTKRLKRDADLALLYVSLDEPGDRDKWLKALKAHNFLGTQLLAPGGYKGPIARAYGINELPTKFIIDRKGNFYETKLPYTGRVNTLVDRIEQALAER